MATGSLSQIIVSFPGFSQLLAGEAMLSSEEDTTSSCQQVAPSGTESHSLCAGKPHLYQAAALPGRLGATGPLADKEMQSSC